MHSVQMVHDLISVTWQLLYKRQALASTWKLSRNTILDEFVCLYSAKKYLKESNST